MSMEPRPLNKEIGRIQERDDRELRVQVSIPYGHLGVSLRRFNRFGKKAYADPEVGFWLSEKHLDTLIELLQRAKGEIRLAQQARAKVLGCRTSVTPSVLCESPKSRARRPRSTAVPMSNRYEEREIHIDVADPFDDEEALDPPEGDCMTRVAPVD